jgi:hypothetical protein
VFLGTAFLEHTLLIPINFADKFELGGVGLSDHFGVNTCFSNRLLSGHAVLVPILLLSLLLRWPRRFEHIRISIIFVFKVFLCKCVFHNYRLNFHLERFKLFINDLPWK